MSSRAPRLPNASRKLAERLGVSPRPLTGRFEDEVGLAPKRFARIRGFRAFAGTSPSGLLEAGGNRANHVALLE